jgi:hypothetical protein
MTPIVIRPRLLLVISKWAYAQDDRPHLNMVRFGDDELCATDGHRCVIAPVETHGQTFGIRPKEIAAIAALHRECGKKYGDITIAVRPPADGPKPKLRPMFVVGIAEESSMTLELRTSDVSGYLPIHQIISTQKETPEPPTYGFNASYLAAIDEVMREHPSYDHGRSALKCTGWSAIGKDGICGPMSFTGLGMTFVVMPMRGERTE